MNPAEQTVMGIGRGYQLSQALYVAAKLGVADVLVTEPLPAEAIAEAVDARAPILRRVLRALVAGGVFTELEDGLREQRCGRGAARRRARRHARCGHQLRRGDVSSVRRAVAYGPYGETAFDVVFGAPLFEYYAANPQAEASAAARMLARTLPVAAEVAASDVVRDARTLVDVGGGTGTLLAKVLRHRPEMAGVLLERPGMLELARGYLAEQGVADRCELVPGDFFSSVPAGGDLYVVAYAGGRERTEAEFRRLLDQARLRLVSATPLAAGPHVLEAAAL